MSMYRSEFQILITLLKKKCLVTFRRGIGRRYDLILLKEEALVEDDMKVTYFSRLKPLGGFNINLTNNSTSWASSHKDTGSSLVAFSLDLYSPSDRMLCTYVLQ